MAEEIAVAKFREYLRINTVQPTPDYKKCCDFLREYTQELGLDFNSYEFVAGKPVVVITLLGSAPADKSIILNSHTDVVPVSAEKWKHDPFGAFKDTDGKIYARGSQDMKCVGIWYLEAIRRLKQQGRLPLKKTLHLTFVPDEEIGGTDGMAKFILSPEFKKLNAGFALDEGLANEEDAFKVYYGERSPWWLWITATGGADSEKQRMETSFHADGTPFRLGDVTTTNITMLKSGVQLNVVHELAEAGIDMRVAATENFDQLREKIKQWVSSVDGVIVEWKQDFPGAAPTLLGATNKEWQVLQSVAKQHGINLDPDIFPAATDSRYLRLHGLPAFGISAIKNTPVLLHDHNEYLHEDTLIQGVPFYADFIHGIANL